jgi:hypothetical protein
MCSNYSSLWGPSYKLSVRKFGFVPWAHVLDVHIFITERLEARIKRLSLEINPGAIQMYVLIIIYGHEGRKIAVCQSQTCVVQIS